MLKNYIVALPTAFTGLMHVPLSYGSVSRDKQVQHPLGLSQSIRANAPCQMHILPCHSTTVEVFFAFSIYINVTVYQPCTSIILYKSALHGSYDMNSSMLPNLTILLIIHNCFSPAPHFNGRQAGITAFSITSAQL